MQKHIRGNQNGDRTLSVSFINRNNNLNRNLIDFIDFSEAIHVPFMAKFVVFAKRVDPSEARLRVFCMTDDKEDKTLEYQEHFTEVAKSRDVEVLEGKPQYTEFAGNLVPVTKSGEQLHIQFKAFRENRLPFNVRVKDPHADTVGRALFMREPRVAKGDQPQQPICILNIVLPEQIDPNALPEDRELMARINLMKYNRTYAPLTLNDLRLVDLSNLLGEDWVPLAKQLGFTDAEVNEIVNENPTSTPRQAQSMLHEYIKRKDSDIEPLENALQAIKRDDIVIKCIKVTSVARKLGNLESNYEERDIMKDSESIEELASQDHRDRDELKYSAEEKKIIEDSDGEEDEDDGVKHSVAERREQIQKRLSVERQIPASSQKKEIVQEIVEVKRHSFIDDKKAMHEEEIIMRAPTDNIIKSNEIPDQVKKLKKGIHEDADVSKSDFDKELQDKFKATIKDVESYEHQPSEEIIKEIKKHESLPKGEKDTTITEKVIHGDHGETIVEKTTVTTFQSKPTTITHVITSDGNQTEIADTKSFLEQEILDISKEFPSNLVNIEADKIYVQRTISETKQFLDNEQAPTEYYVEESRDGDAESIGSASNQAIQDITDYVVVSNNGTDKKLSGTKDLLQDDEFYRTIEEKITKKMSQDFSVPTDDIVTGMSPSMNYYVIEKNKNLI